jgi:hypothetical protein
MLMRRKGAATWYYRRAIPANIRPLLGGQREFWKSLRTSDQEAAKLLSLRVGQEVERELQALGKRGADALGLLRVLRAGKLDDPEALAREYEGRALADDAQWRVNRGPVDDARLDAELLGLSNAVEDHGEALEAGDTVIVTKLLSELLEEHGLHVSPSRRAEFAHALLRARFRTLEVAVKRTQGEPVDGTTVDGLLESYLQERKLGSKSEHEV